MTMSITVAPALPKLLIVDDAESLREQLLRAFQRRGYEVHAAVDHSSAIDLARQIRFDRAVVDLRMPGPSGLEVLQDLLTLQPELRVVILTGFGSIPNALESVRLGAVNYVSKPANADEIDAAFGATPDVPAPQSAPVVESTPSLARAEWEHIQRVLSDCNGNISQTAFRLGISRRSLQRKLRKLAP